MANPLPIVDVNKPKFGTWKIEYKGNVVSLNDYKSKHWRDLKKKIDPLKTQFTILIIKSKMPKLKWFELTLRHNTRLDMDNVVGTVKPFVDCLRKCNKVKEDTCKEWDLLTIKHDRDLPKKTVIFEITGETL